MDIGEMKQQTEDTLSKLAETVKQIKGISDSPNHRAKREHLKAVCASIRQLERKGISIPDNFRGIKTDLTSELAIEDQYRAIMDMIRTEVKTIASQLGLKVITAGSSGQWRRTPRRHDIRLADLFEAGLLRDRTEILHRVKRGAPGQIYRGLLRSTGQIEIEIDGKQQCMDNLSAAAGAFTHRPTNGWSWWLVRTDGGTEVPLTEIREQFQNSRRERT